MHSLYDARRFLTEFDSNRVPNIFTDVLVIGGGAAGLRTAIEIATRRDVIVLVKTARHESNTALAQGGIAAALNGGDAMRRHEQDTLRVGCGLCSPEAVAVLVREGPQRVRELIDWGAAFDRAADGELDLGREGGHTDPRVVHARGDATGLELTETLLRTLSQNPRVRIFEQCFAVDLITEENVCCGAITFHPRYGHQLIWSHATVLASGGCGQLYRETTNPAVATADGHAMAWRAGVVLADMEFVQFHPTTLYVAGAGRALISEAVRGEGAYLVDRGGRRFMVDVHPQAELAPRDVVSRAMLAHMIQTGVTCVYLDVRHLPADAFRRRFPSISALCARFDIDVAKDLIPVRPSAHYMIGGVQTDARGRTSLDRLWACGEAAATGVHGANRLASNSLLEGLVFGSRCGRDIVESLAGETSPPRTLRLVNRIARSDRTELDVPDVRNSLRSVMWRNAGIERNADRLEETLEIIEFWGRYVLDKVLDDGFGWETQNMLTAARLIATAALYRTESRGVHYRADYSEPNPRTWNARHTRLWRLPEGRLHIE